MPTDETGAEAGAISKKRAVNPILRSPSRMSSVRHGSDDKACDAPRPVLGDDAAASTSDQASAILQPRTGVLCSGRAGAQPPPGTSRRDRRRERADPGRRKRCAARCRRLARRGFQRRGRSRLEFGELRDRPRLAGGEPRDGTAQQLRSRARRRAGRAARLAERGGPVGEFVDRLGRGEPRRRGGQPRILRRLAPHAQGAPGGTASPCPVERPRPDDRPRASSTRSTTPATSAKTSASSPTGWERRSRPSRRC